jgi:hypothetical protein
MRAFLIELACILIGLYIGLCSTVTGWYAFELRTSSMMAWTLMSVAIGVLPFTLAQIYLLQPMRRRIPPFVGSDEPLNQFHV